MMNDVKNNTELEKLAEGQYRLKGRLDFQTVPGLWAANRVSLFDDSASLFEIDLSHLDSSDSSGLALLIEWYREAKLQNKQIIFYNLPAQMYHIARISDLHEILPLSLR